MAGKIIVRKAVPNDVEAICDITLEAFTKYAYDLGQKDKIAALQETVETVASDIKTKNVFIGLLDQTPMGSIRFEVIGGIAYISRFGVKLMAQGCGLGRSLIREVEACCRAMPGVEAIALHTSSRMASLMRFYYGQGFFVHSTTTERGYIRALMVRELTVPCDVDYAAISHK
ncbi:MAG: GNAT family N-acetyltransferase [Christensenellales bacterium]